MWVRYHFELAIEKARSDEMARRIIERAKEGNFTQKGHKSIIFCPVWGVS